MAENQQELKIPVLIVLRGNCILMTLFLMKNPRRITENVEQRLFHLHIQSDCFARSVYITDLSTMFGTCISGERIEAEVRTRLNEGDTLLLGASTRMYKLDWVPVNCAFDGNGRFLAQVPGSIRIAQGATHQNMKRKSWCILPDTGCLLKRESREQLQLLRGSRGTSLVVASTVITELDGILRCEKTEASATLRCENASSKAEASAALGWIEQCMKDTSWWIKVQDEEEEVNISGDKGILEYALFLKGTMNHGEGVVCETAEEFRWSLSNPFSARFLYPGSTPIGPLTWSIMDDTVLKNMYKYHPSP